MNRMIQILMATLVFLMWTMTMHADPPTEEEYERVLIPLLIGGEAIPGAHGSLWKTFFTGYNASESYVSIVPHVPYTCSLLCPTPPADAGSTFDAPGGNRGLDRMFVYVHESGSNQVHFQLRVQDVSRQSLTWGTEIPVIRESDHLQGKSVLLEVPLDSRFRQTLRVYGLDARDGAQLWLRIYDMDGSNPIVTRILTLDGATFHEAGSATRPSYTEVGSMLASYPELEGLERVRVEIEPLKTDQPYWAFISITNNETQHVTLITP